MSDRRAMSDHFDKTKNATPNPTPPRANMESTLVNFRKATSQTAEAVNTTEGMVLQYPYENQDYYMAAIKFSLYKIDPYEIDAEAAKNIIDTPYLTKSVNVESKITKSSIQDTKSAGDGNIKISNSYDDQATYGNFDPGLIAEIKARESAETKNTATNRDLSLAPKALNQHISLYFPPNVQSEDTVAYDNAAQLGTGGATTLAALRNGGGILSSVSKGVMEGVSDLFGLLKGDILTQEAAQVAATRAFNKLPAGGIQNASRVALQKILNPNTRSMFQGVPIREFTFVFKLVATSASEAEEIRKIVRKFRSEMYPEAIQFSGFPVGYKFPSMFKIQYMYNNQLNTKLPQPLMCYLRNVSTTYNGASMVFHSDGNPTEIDLSLSFTEFRALTKQDILEGSKATNVGPH